MGREALGVLYRPLFALFRDKRTTYTSEGWELPVLGVIITPMDQLVRTTVVDAPLDKTVHRVGVAPTFAVR